MTAEAEARQKLLSIFEGLPEEKLKRLGARIELDRQDNLFALPHQTVMDMMRPYLAAIRAPRVYTPQRILCVPFEDLLTFPDPDFKKRGVLGRGSIAVMWDWVTKDLAASEFQDLAEQFTDAQKGGDQQQANDCAKQIWRLCADRMRKAFEEADDDIAKFDAISDRLGGAHRFEEVEEMSKVLQIAPYIEALKEDLPLKPIIGLTAEHVSMIAETYKTVAEEEPGCELYLLLVIMGRLLQPFPILKVFRLLSRDKDDSAVRRTDLSVAGDIVIEALENDAKQVADAMRSTDVDEEEVVRKATRFAAAFKGITTDIGIHRDGEWGKRMYGSRAIVSKAVEDKVLKGATDTIKSSLPIQGGKVSDALSDWPDDDMFETAERRAKALGQTLRISEQLGLKAACTSAVTELRRDFDDMGVQLIDKLGSIDPANEGPAFANMCMVVRLTELVSNSEQADMLRRRGRTALQEAAGRT